MLLVHAGRAGANTARRATMPLPHSELGVPLATDILFPPPRSSLEGGKHLGDTTGVNGPGT